MTVRLHEWQAPSRQADEEERFPRLQTEDGSSPLLSLLMRVAKGLVLWTGENDLFTRCLIISVTEGDDSQVGQQPLRQEKKREKIEIM